MPKAPGDMTLAQLEELLSARKSQLESLIRERAKLERELAQIDKKIASLEGDTGGARRKITLSRPRNEKSLHAVVLELLSKNKKGYTLSDLAKQVLDTGYKTNSTNFPNVLYQCLYNSNKFYHDEKTGTYKLAPTKGK